MQFMNHTLNSSSRQRANHQSLGSCHNSIIPRDACTGIKQNDKHSAHNNNYHHGFAEPNCATNTNRWFLNIETLITTLYHAVTASMQETKKRHKALPE